MTRSDILKQKYAILRNYTADSQLSNKAKHWSNERIYKELGIVIPKKSKQVLKPLPSKKKIAIKKRELNKFIYARELGLDIKEAKKLKKYKQGKIASTYDYITNLSIQEYNEASRKERYELWVKWSKEDVLPPSIKRMAEKINLETVNREGRLDDTSRYGFAVLFYSFIENKSIEDIKKMYVVDEYDGDRYREIIKKL